MKQAKEPFQFVAASYLICIGHDRPTTLRDLSHGIAKVSEASIFCHTFHSLSMHHYTSYSSDFAQWAMAACNEQELAERLGGIDVRQFVAIEDLRSALVHTIDSYLHAQPRSSDRPAFEPFFFSETREIALPLEMRALNLAELAEGIRRLSVQSLHFHFVNSRLRLHLRTNDFSHWIERELGFPELAARIDRVDFYTNTLQGVRDGILECIRPWINR
ncbi:MAG: DUF5752 family protein [Candidatus Acidiferrales bacterium]